MNVNSKALLKLAKEKEWSIPELASKLGVEYSYLFRVLFRNKNGGSKLFSGIYLLCKQEDLNIEEFIFLQESLSVNNAVNQD